MQTKMRRLREFVSNHLLQALLLLATIIGLIFILIIPPWEHYDEPGHFEYAWLIANKSEWPKEGDYDQSMRREIGASMLEHNFHEYSIYHLLNTKEPISIIVPQTGDVPLYYFLVSIPLRLVKYSDITFQLYVARFVSFGLFLLTVFIAYKSTTLLFPKGHSLRWMIPLFMICLPGFVDIMTAVNNDAGAIAFFTFFIYASLLILVQGISIKRTALLLLAVILCVLTKSSSILSAPLSVLIIVFCLIKKIGVGELITIGIATISLVFLFLFTFSNSTPANFYATKDNYLPVTVNLDEAPLGKRVIVQTPQDKKWPKYYSVFSANELTTTDNQTLTLGAWIWADTPTVIQFPIIQCRKTETHFIFTENPVQITDTPAYYSFSATASETLTSLCWISFNVITDQDNNIYWDGILLAEGQFDDESPPIFIDNNADEVVWGGTTLNNLIMNGSGEKRWPVFSSLMEKTLVKYLNISGSNIFSVFEQKHFSWYFKSTLAQIFRSFWGIFGWGSVYFTGAHPYRFFLAFSSIGLLGWCLTIRQKRTIAQTKAELFFIIVILLQLILVIFRGVGSWFVQLFIPSARYLYPVVYPISLFLVVGYYKVIKILNKRLHISKRLLSLIYICVLISTVSWAILSIS